MWDGRGSRSWPHPPWPAPAIRSAQRRHCCFECDSTRNGETANRGDVMRLSVRSVVQVNLSFGFSRTPRMTRCLTKPIDPIARQTVFIVKGCLKKKRQRFPKLPPVFPVFLYVTVCYPRPGWRILTPFSFKVRGKSLRVRKHTCLVRID